MRLLTLYTEAYKENSPQSNVLSQFDYAYNAAGNITQWTRQAGTGAPLRYDLGYDKASQLTSAVSTNTVTNAVTKQYFYGYDAAANRTSEQIDTGVSQATYNNVNALTAVSSGSGPVRFQGTLNEPGTVTVNGTAAAMTTATNFVANPVLASGTNYVTINAQDGSGNVQSNIYKVVIDAGTGRTLGYDTVGSLTNNGAGQTYEWDAAKHLVAINYASGPVARTEFTYDGLGQRVKLVEKDSNGTPTSTKQFIWSPGDPQPSEERDASNTVTKRFYPQGEQIAGQSYYYTRDHLGSVRELTDSTGAIAAQYDYDPYGRRTKVQGAMDGDFGYTGHYEHATSGLKLTLCRAYDAELGRWISRDPLGEEGGINLYEYANNGPVVYIDPDGKNPLLIVAIVAAAFVATPDVANAPAPGDSTASSTGPMGMVGAAAAAAVAATAAEASAGALGKDLKLDGPQRGGRICQIRWKSTPLLRLDNHPIPSSGGKPVLHLNVGPGNGPNSIHISIWPLN